MSSVGTSLTEAEIEKIRRFNESGNPDDLLDSGTVKTNNNAREVSVKECREWRRYLRENTSTAVSSVPLEQSYSSTTVRKHAHGRCSHPDSAVGEPAPALSRWERR